MSDESILKDVLESFFCQGVAFEYSELQGFLNDPQFPTRARKFKRELADAILNHTITPQEFESLTAVDQESQDDVDSFLMSEIWNPLYDNEPVRPLN